MPFRLRKAPKRELYWVVGEDGKKYSKDPLPKERAEAQRRALYAAETRGGGPSQSKPKEVSEQERDYRQKSVFETVYDKNRYVRGKMAEGKALTAEERDYYNTVIVPEDEKREREKRALQSAPGSKGMEALERARQTGRKAVMDERRQEEAEQETSPLPSPKIKKTFGRGRDGPVVASAQQPPPPPPPPPPYRPEHYRKKADKKKPTKKEIDAMMALGRSMGLEDDEIRVRMGLAPPPLIIPPRGVDMEGFSDSPLPRVAMRRGRPASFDGSIPMPLPLPPRERNRVGSISDDIEELTPEDQAEMMRRLPPAFDRRGQGLSGCGFVMKIANRKDSGKKVYLIYDTEKKKVLSEHDTNKKAIDELNRLNTLVRMSKSMKAEEDEFSDDELKEIMGKGKTHKEKVLKKLGVPDEGYSIAELAKMSGVPRKTLQEVYNRGIGAYKTNPTSVRMKGSYAKNVVAPMDKKLSKEQWAMARIYSFLNGSKKHDQDLRGGGPMPPRNELQSIASASYNPPPPPTIGNLRLLQGSNTLVFYFGQPNTIVVGIRGTVPSDGGDLKADASIVVGQLRSSQRFKQDLATLQQFQLKYPPSQYDYYGVGHSLGGAILDEFLKMGLIKKGVSYNPAVQPQTLFSKTDNERVYEKGDPLYQLIGRFTNPEVRDTQSKKPKSIVSRIPYLGKAYDYLQSHGLANFAGGAKAHGEFAKQLHEVGIEPSSYLRIAQSKAKKAGLPHTLLGFADDGEHKLAIPDKDGKIVKFGAVGYGDHILWSDAEARDEVPKGYADQKRRTFQKSHRAIKGDWKKNPFSPNSLALSVLW